MALDPYRFLSNEIRFYEPWELGDEEELFWREKAYDCGRGAEEWFCESGQTLSAQIALRFFNGFIAYFDGLGNALTQGLRRLIPSEQEAIRKENKMIDEFKDFSMAIYHSYQTNPDFENCLKTRIYMIAAYYSPEIVGRVFANMLVMSLLFRKLPVKVMRNKFPDYPEYIAATGVDFFTMYALGQGVALVSAGGDGLDYIEEAARTGDKINPEELLTAMLEGRHSQRKRNAETVDEALLRSYRGLFNCIKKHEPKLMQGFMQ